VRLGCSLSRVGRGLYMGTPLLGGVSPHGGHPAKRAPRAYAPVCEPEGEAPQALPVEGATLAPLMARDFSMRSSERLYPRS